MSFNQQFIIVADKLVEILQSRHWKDILPDDNHNWGDWQSDIRKDVITAVSELLLCFRQSVEMGLPLFNNEQHMVLRVLHLAEELNINEAHKAVLAIERAMINQGMQDVDSGRFYSNEEVETFLDNLDDPEWLEYQRLKEKFNDKY